MPLLEILPRTKIFVLDLDSIYHSFVAVGAGGPCMSGGEILKGWDVVPCKMHIFRNIANDPQTRDRV